MYPPPLQSLIDIFTKLPGVGPRQAARFAFSLLKNGTIDELRAALQNISERVGFCNTCFRAIEKNEKGLCDFCASPKRNHSIVAVVEKESDMQNLEKTGAYQGVYHILGGTLSPLDPDSPRRLRLRGLYDRIKNTIDRGGQCEVVLATNPTTEGDTTALYIERVLDPLKKAHAGLTISRLGRGLSLGSELEHVDEVTIKNALTNRK